MKEHETRFSQTRLSGDRHSLIVRMKLAISEIRAPRRHAASSSATAKRRSMSRACPTLQQALENWRAYRRAGSSLWHAERRASARRVCARYRRSCASPLPRAYQWLDGSAYVNHVELVRKSRGVEMPESFWTDPLMYQGGSDTLLGPRDDIPLPDEKYGIDFEAEIAIITDDVPMGVTRGRRGASISSSSCWSTMYRLRYLAMPELAKGFGFVQAKPATAFSPVAVTPDSLGDAWKDGKLHLPLIYAITMARYSASPTRASIWCSTFRR